MEAPRAGSPPAGPWSTCIFGLIALGVGVVLGKAMGIEVGDEKLEGLWATSPEPGNILEKLKTETCVSPFVSLLFPFLSPNYYIC